MTTPSSAKLSKQNAQGAASPGELLRALVAQATHLAVAQIDAFAARLSNALFSSSEQLADARQANLSFNAAQLLKNNGYAFYYLASSTLEKELRRETQQLQSGIKGSNQDGLDKDVALTLVSYEEMETKLAFGRLSRGLELACAEQLAALNMRLATVLDTDGIGTSHNPFRPEVFLKSLNAAWCEFSPDQESHGLVLPLLRSDILFDLAPILEALNKSLVDKGILTELQESYRVKKGSSGAHKPEAAKADMVERLKQYFAGGEGAAQAFSGGYAAPAAGVGGQGGTAAGATVQGARNGNGNGNSGAAPGNAGRAVGGEAQAASSSNPFPPLDMTMASNAFPPLDPAVASNAFSPLDAAIPRGATETQLFSYLADLQKGMAIRQMVAGAQTVMRLSQLKEQMPELATSSVERSTLDLLSKIFDTVFRNDTIPNEIKELIGILQIPVLKAALIDKDFFFQDDHPARQLIDMLAKHSVAWDQKKGQDDPLFQTLRHNVNRVQQEFDQKVELFSEVSADIQRFVERDEAATTRALQEPIDKALKREKIKQANISASNEVSMRIGTGEVVAFVETFLEDRWVKVLTLAYTIKEEKPNAVNDAIKTMDDLIWSTKPKITVQQRQELITRLPSILNTLNKWLNVIKWDDTDRKQFFADLAECHASIVRAPLDLSPERQLEIAVEVAQKAAERRLELKAKTEPEPEPDEFSEQVESLERGIWLQFAQAGGEPVKVKLAWVSPMRSLYIFTTSQKDKSFSISVEDLELAFRNKRAQVLMLDKLVDRALEEALEQPAQPEQELVDEEATV